MEDYFGFGHVNTAVGAGKHAWRRRRGSTGSFARPVAVQRAPDELQGEPNDSEDNNEA